MLSANAQAWMTDVLHTSCMGKQYCCSTCETKYTMAELRNKWSWLACTNADVTNCHVLACVQQTETHKQIHAHLSDQPYHVPQTSKLAVLMEWQPALSEAAQLPGVHLHALSN